MSTEGLEDLLGGAMLPKADISECQHPATLDSRPAHSPLGASGAERWMNCPGSVELIRNLMLPESDDPSYRTEGTAAHDAAAKALCLAGQPDGWELIGQKFGDKGKEIECTEEMANAIQVYLNFTRPIMAAADEAGKRVMIEYPISSPAHEDFYGTCDFAAIVPGTDHHGQENLVVVDLKYGEGIQVEVEDNSQLKYYAYGVLQEFPECDKVTLVICQPRGFHADGPIRTWDTTAAEIRAWVAETLVPAMERVEFDQTLDPGKWCRFCPAKLACPVLSGLFKAAATANPAEIVNYSDESLARSYAYRDAVKSYVKALEDEVFNRLQKGKAMPGAKLVHKIADRVWKPEAEVVFKSRFPDQYLAPPKMRSPAEMEELGVAAKELVKEYAYKPESGLTVAPESDKRGAVKVQQASEVFAGAVKNLATGSTDDFPDVPPELRKAAG